MLATTVLPIVLGVLAVLLLVLFVGGYLANARRRRALATRLQTELEAADAALAAARAEDRGWERSAIEAAAREALSARHPGEQPRALHLVQVVDRPGTDEDQAVVRAELATGREATVVLGRRDGAWVAMSEG